MRISSYKTSSAILIEEYYVFSKLKYQTSCTLTSIKSSAFIHGSISTSMNKCISHVGHQTPLIGVLTPAAKGAKPIKCPDYISETLCRQQVVPFYPQVGSEWPSYRGNRTRYKPLFQSKLFLLQR